MMSSGKKSGRRTGGFNGKYIIPLLILAALVMLAALAVGADGDGNLSEIKEWDCGPDEFETAVKAKLDTETGVMTISGTGLMKDYDSVASVPWDGARSSIKSVVVEDGVKSVGSNTFRSCTQLTTVTIGNDVTDIGSNAFNGCTQLASMTIGDNVKTIGVHAFEACTFTKITIPNSVTSIGDNAFLDCTRLASITIGKNVKGISPTAFPNHVFFDEDRQMAVSELAGNVFNDNGQRPGGKIMMVKVDSEVIDGVEYIFGGNSAVIIGINGFNKSELTVATVMHGGKEYAVTGIDTGAFENCKVLEKLTISKYMQVISANAFKGCTNLKEITIKGSSANSNEIIIDENAFVSHAFFTENGTPLAMPDLPGYKYKADGTVVAERIKMVREESSPTPTPTPTPAPTPAPTPDKQTDDPTAAFLIVVSATVIALTGLALIIARRK